MALKSLPFVVLFILLSSGILFAFGSLRTGHVLADARDSENRAFVFGASVPEIYFGSVTGSSKEPVAVSVYVYDADNDQLHLEYEWGDGTSNETTDVTGTDSYPEVIVYHTWNASYPGFGDQWVQFTMNVTATDVSSNSVTVSIPVDIFVPYNYYPIVAISSSTSIFDPGQPVNITANATDFEGDPLTWTFVFSNETAPDYDTKVFYSDWSAANVTVWNNITATFAEPGNYSVKMYVSDALPGAQVGIHNNSIKSSTIRVALNRLPFTTGSFTTNPTTLEINSTIGEINVTFSIEVLDQDGDALNITWDFGDGSPLAYNETLGGKDAYKISQWRVYNETAQVNITVVVTDGKSGHDVVVSGTFNITSSNQPPVGRVGFQYSPGRTFALPNETIQFTMMISDPELDVIEVIIDFGDNTTLEYYNLTDYSGGNVTLVFDHAYSRTGSFMIIIWYSDNIMGFGEHQLYYNLTIDVSTPTIVPEKMWTWWDSTSLALFSMIPVVVVLNFVRIRRKRKEIENEGMTLEEWKVKKSEMKGQRVQEGKKEG